MSGASRRERAGDRVNGGDLQRGGPVQRGQPFGEHGLTHWVWVHVNIHHHQGGTPPMTSPNDPPAGLRKSGKPAADKRPADKDGGISLYRDSRHREDFEKTAGMLWV